MKNIKNNGKATPPPTENRMANAETAEHLERNKYVYELVNGWIENADNKVSVSCGLFTGVFGIVTFLTERYIKVPDNPVVNECWRVLYKGSFIVSLILMALAVFFYAKAIIPNLKSAAPTNKAKKKYPIFYGDIQSLEFNAYHELINKGTNKEFNDEIERETWHNSGVCMKKMRRYKMGVILSISAIGFAFFSFVAHFMMYK